MKSAEMNCRKAKVAIIRSEPMIKTNLQPFWLKAFDIGFTRMLRKAFYAVHIKNAENYELRDKSRGNIIFASHCCWWDGMIGYHLCRNVFKTRLHMMIEELYRFPLLSKIGAFSVEKDSPQSAIKALNYSTEILQKPENSLWIFPQGLVKPPDYRPIEFAGGMSYLCKKLEGVNLIPVAHRYNFIREDRPEVFIEIGKPIIVNNNKQDRKEFTHRLESEFTALMDKQREDISSGNLDEYKKLLQSRLCIVKRVEKRLKQFIRNFNT